MSQQRPVLLPLLLVLLVVLAGLCGTARACTTDADCEAATPRCADGVCGACVDDTSCADRGTRTHCRAAGDGACVECLADADCTADPHAPVCTDGTCTAAPVPPCTADADCAGNASGPVCDLVGGSAHYGACVACTAARHCATDAAPRCTPARVCAACAHDADCLYTHGNRTHCDTNASSATHGHCVLAAAAPRCVSVLAFLFLFLALALALLRP